MASHYSDRGGLPRLRLPSYRQEYDADGDPNLRRMVTRIVNDDDAMSMFSFGERGKEQGEATGKTDVLAALTDENKRLSIRVAELTKVDEHRRQMDERTNRELLKARAELHDLKSKKRTDDDDPFSTRQKAVMQLSSLLSTDEEAAKSNPFAAPSFNDNCGYDAHTPPPHLRRWVWDEEEKKVVDLEVDRERALYFEMQKVAHKIDASDGEPKKVSMRECLVELMREEWDLILAMEKRNDAFNAIAAKLCQLENGTFDRESTAMYTDWYGAKCMGMQQQLLLQFEKDKRGREMVYRTGERCISAPVVFFVTKTGVVNSTRKDSIEDKLNLNCAHVQSNCHLYYACCNSYYPCPECHAEKAISPSCEKGVLKKPTYLLCRVCNNCQPIDHNAGNCNRCTSQTAAFVCYKCALFCNPRHGDPVHCRKCNKCRFHGEMSEHCDGCETCVPRSFWHHCDTIGEYRGK